MKTIIKISTSLLLLILFCNISIAQQRMVVFSVDEADKNGHISYSFSSLKDNFFNLTLTARWTDAELRPVNDRFSVVGFKLKDLKISSPYVNLISHNIKDNDVLAFNNELELKFEVREEFPGGEIKIEFPFFYSPFVNEANNPNMQMGFSFARPRNYVAINNINATDIVDKTPPRIAVLEPEGIEEGLTPIIESDNVRIELVVTDFFGIDRVTVNNISAQKLTDSTYIADLVLRYGFRTPVNVIAVDVNNLRSERSFYIESRQPARIAAAPADRSMRTIEHVEEVSISELVIDLPDLGERFPDRFALIIGNEDYSTYQTGLRPEADVDFAIRDANTFKEFAIKILGISEENIIMLTNANERQMRRALNQINALARASQGKAEIFAFYAGHGFPDEQTREPYLIPVDVSAVELQYAIKLTDFYGKLTEHPAKRVTVFIDACFSGGGREQGLLAARAVRVRPRESDLSGNLVVFAASTGDESALPWKEKGHGMFTYNLLDKLRETEGNISYGELADHLRASVLRRSILINQRDQTPQINVSPNVDRNWEEWTLR